MLGHSLIVFQNTKHTGRQFKARKLVRNDFGPSPKVDTVPRFMSKEEGFYNFILKIIKIFILPDWLTEFIQVRLNICLDISS
jgi:hypothetical protein